jgi:hypothetical protein
MTHYTETPEVYPGQHAAIAARISEHNVQLDRDSAAEARHGGRYITGALANTLLGYGANPGLRARFAGEDGPEKLAEIWRYTASPSGSEWPASGRDTTARYAQSAARIGGVDWEHSAYWQAPKLPESAFDWPIYRAGMGDAQALLDALVETEGATIEDANRIDACIRVLRVIPGVAF